jgi:hypothetical protein
VRRVVLLALAACACSDEVLTPGATEPIRVYDAELKEAARFKAGKLPGKRPLTDAEVAEGVKPAMPNITSLIKQNGLTFAGATGKDFTGRASPTAATVAIGFEGAGSGYWLVPVGAPDPQNNGEFAFHVTVDFGSQVPTGTQHLRFVALDDEGRAGTQSDEELCISRAVPDNLNACRPNIAPPALVLSLAWDRPVDLDLQLVTPDGKLVDPKHPSTARSEGDGGIPTPLPADVGVLDRDSNGGCFIDGHQLENLVFQEKPPKGHYLVYANLFDSCGEPAVRFSLSFHASQAGRKPDTFQVVETYRTSGELLRIHENGGHGKGLYVTEFDSK